MALGFSGSNGGISKDTSRFDIESHTKNMLPQENDVPLEVSYFVNNECNLRCKHCYVGYTNNSSSLATHEWIRVFDSLISMGALTFGNVGKEPVISWTKTYELLSYFYDKRAIEKRLRYGLVTNGTLLNLQEIYLLDALQPNYLDISVDGTESVHNFIRGDGSFNRTLHALQNIAIHGLREAVFISFTINTFNANAFPEMLRVLYDLGFSKFLISPHVALRDSDKLVLSMKDILSWIKKLLDGELVHFHKYEGLELYVKNDYAATSNLMNNLVNIEIINKGNLFVDSYGVIFSQYCYGTNLVYFNYLCQDDYLKRAIRISHDGFVGNCLDMFFEDYPSRALGNIRQTPIEALLIKNVSAIK